MLLDATWVSCSDSTESLFIYNDGRAVFARYDRGMMLEIGSALLRDLHSAIDKATSRVDTAGLDSCATLGVVLAGPRYLLVNSRRPSEQMRDLDRRLERLRNYGRRQLELIGKLSSRADADDDTAAATVDEKSLRENIRPSDIAREWGCRGRVVVAVRVAYDGRIREAFVEDASVRGKCAALLTSTALRAVMRSAFQPALDRDGKAIASWLRIEFSFGPSGATSRAMTSRGR